MSKSQWELLIEGDKEAFIFIYETFYQDLFTYGFSLSGDKELTKDCLQDMFLEIWYNRAQLNREVANIRSYLFTWLRRKIHKDLKQQTTHSYNGTHPAGTEHELPYEELLIRFQQNAEDRQKLTVALAKLTKKQLQIIKLRYFDNLSYEQIAEKTSLTGRTVYNHVYEAIRHLRSCMRISLLFLIHYINSR